ncbi:hypothetical protein ACFSL6_11740 [Paenibacillus thailandensis]|uniref:Polyketide cyclase n=1 Tax=Paenibacillus thailandensis TaxID=393250 RepID=A0ABW5QTN2_9BACL
MYTYNEEWFDCTPQAAFELANQVELWPKRLSHYRTIRFREGSSNAMGGIVEMAAVRSFRRLHWPVRWVSDMKADPAALLIQYRHVEGVTRGMDVEWRFEAWGAGTKVSIVHRWDKPPIGRRLAADRIGKHFVHFIAGQTLQGLKTAAESTISREAGYTRWASIGQL